MHEFVAVANEVIIQFQPNFAQILNVLGLAGNVGSVLKTSKCQKQKVHTQIDLET